jgi:hypothetical protein
MKNLFNILKFLTGALFVFSGMVKLNDPSGFSIKLNEYFDVFADDVKSKQDSVQFECFVNGKSMLSGKLEINPFQSKPIYSMYLGIPGGGHVTGCQKNHETLASCDCVVSYAVYFQKDNSNATIYTSAGQKELKLDSAQWSQVSYSVVFKHAGEHDGQTQWVQEFKKKGYKNRITDEGSGPMTGGPDFSIHEEIDLTPLIKPNGLMYDFFKWMKNYSLQLSMFFCALEVILGFALILGWQFIWVWTITTVLIVFFTFLTGYSAYFNKVTDCGCFGDFIKLKPWDSFKKDVVLSVVVLLLFLGRKFNEPLLSNVRLSNYSMAVLSAATWIFGLVCYYYLPIWDFLPYKKGNDIKKIMYEIPAGERDRDSTLVKFVMFNGKDSIRVGTSDYANSMKNGYQFVRTDIQIIIEGYKSPIHDFAIYDPIKGDLKDSFLNSNDFQLVWVAPFLESANSNALRNINAIYDVWMKKGRGYNFYALSSASPDYVKSFIKKEQLHYSFYSADQKMLMSMARYNPTLFLFKGSKVIQKWSGVNLPDSFELENLILKKWSN